MISPSITTDGRALVRHRDGTHYRAEQLEIRDGMVIAIARRTRPGKGHRPDPATRYAWPAKHVTVRWEPEEGD